MSRSLLQELSEVDQGWQQRHPASPTRLVESHRAELDPSELVELLAADLEWRWREAGVYAVPVHEPWSHADDLRPRSVEVYLEQFAPWAGEDDVKLRLIEAEYVARSRWGKPPLVVEFVERFPEVFGIEARLRRCLEEISLVYVTFQRQGKQEAAEAKTFAVRTPLSIGRQSASEPRDALLLQERQRLVVATNYQHGVSREHALLVRQSLDRCLVANMSAHGQMSVNGLALPSGWRQLLLLPLTIEIANVRLVFSQQ